MSTTEPHETDRRARRRADHLLFQRFHRTGDPVHRDAVIERFMPLAHKLARRYTSGHDSLDDLTQVAMIGLIKAVDRFDPTRGMAFSTFAVPTISGELKRYFRDHTWAVRPPRDLLERSLRIERLSQRLTAELGRVPTVPELTSRCDDLDEEAVLEALVARRAAAATSLQAPRSDEDGHEDTLGDRLAAQDDGIGQIEQRIALQGLQRVLGAREREVVRLYFVDDRSQAQIGEVIGVSQMQISRILRGAIERMRIAADHGSPGSTRPSPIATGTYGGGHPVRDEPSGPEVPDGWLAKPRSTGSATPSRSVPPPS